MMPDHPRTPVYDRAIELLRTWLKLLPQQDPWRALSREAVFVLVLGVVIFTIERAYRRDMGRYRTRTFANDLAYSFLYQGGLYNLLIYVPIFSVLQKQLAVFDLHILTSLPPAVAFVTFWLTTDFVGYWLHRLQHSNSFLWAFHSIHHGPGRITFLTSNRNHPLDQLIANFILFIPLLILGVPKTVWIPFLLVHSAIESLQHAALSWRYGPLYRLVVSPMFHNLHHSSDPLEYNGNYGKILSIWDFVFGTAVDRNELPLKFGIEGMEIPETVSGQLLTPFRTIRSQSGRRREASLAEPAGTTP
jgi:sterol desaturase/sphingolipid hydroxylase (fatty acid hydroxylase superfamily)